MATGQKTGGRKAGTPNRWTVLVRERLDAEGAEPAAELVKIARAAEANDNLELAADCWGKLAAFAYPKPRPVVIDPDALVELEGRIAAARLQAQSDVLEARPGLADRLLRVMAHLDAETPPTILQPVTIIEAEPQRASRDPEPVEAETPAASAFPPVTPPDPMPVADAALIGAAPAPYTPILPWPEQSAFAQMDYDPTK